ncbi:MAG TPA: hypothetical protein VFQ50_10420 [Flavobacterium sp.]|jgi:hypothetical protein|nr:hypothetical protein [Flavobacterium sp.]
MKSLKNFIVGLLVSFAGSIPLGYLNLIGYEIYSVSGSNALLSYIGGVILVEAIVIYATLAFAEKLAANKSLSKIIEIFTICFLLFLAVAFWIQPGVDGAADYSKSLPSHSFFVIGIILSGLNFIQIPFWTGWNLYLVNSGFISTNGKVRYLYLLGTLVGTFCGMMLLIKAISAVTKSVAVPELLISHLIPLVFLLLALYNLYRFYRKYHVTQQ